MEYGKDFEDGFEYTSLGALHYMHHPGTAEKLIFLHGMGASTMAWERLVTHLPDNIDVSLLDLLGHGKSDAPDIDYTISAQLQALREFIALKNNGDGYLFGHSYGGWIAAYYASQPYTCKGIILEDAGGLKESIDAIISKGKEIEYKDTMFKSAMMMSGNRDYVIKSILESDFGEDQLTGEVLSRIKVPTMVMWGEDDNILDKKFAYMFQQSISGSALSIISGAGHQPHYSDPDKVATELLGFIGNSSQK